MDLSGTFVNCNNADNVIRRKCKLVIGSFLFQSSPFMETKKKKNEIRRHEQKKHRKKITALKC